MHFYSFTRCLMSWYSVYGLYVDLLPLCLSWNKEVINNQTGALGNKSNQVSPICHWKETNVLTRAITERDEYPPLQHGKVCYFVTMAVRVIQLGKGHTMFNLEL